MCVCVYVCVHVCVRTCVCVYVDVCVHGCVCVFMCVRMSVCVCVCEHVCVCMRAYVSVHTCTCVHACVCVVGVRPLVNGDKPTSNIPYRNLQYMDNRRCMQLPRGQSRQHPTTSHVLEHLNPLEKQYSLTASHYGYGLAPDR